LRDSLTDILVVVIAAIAFVALVRIGKDTDDPVWEERWRALSPAERTRIAAATRSGDLLASPEEIELAAGFARRDRRRLSPRTLANAIRLLLGIALIAGGLAADSIILLAFGFFFFLGGLWAMRGTYQVLRAEREAIARDHPF
jgi:hypothetical protein